MNLLTLSQLRRIPAYCNGVYAIKPSSGRLPYHRLQGYLTDGAENIGILCVNGVMAVSARDCEYLLRVVTEAEPWLYDPGCQYMPWIPDPVPNRPLVIGLITDDRDTAALPPIRRVIAETCKKLQDAGHEIVDVEIHKLSELAKNALALFQIEGGKVCVSENLSYKRARL